jgi:Holliday junction resolvase
MVKKKNQNYACGVGEEQKLAASLKRKGMKDVVVSPGSRGAADITMKRPSGKKAAIQVKSTCTADGKPKKPSEKEVDRLIKYADDNNATAMIALVKGRKKDLYYAKTGRKVII